MKAFSLFFILLLIPATVFAAERPTEFRGIKWGTPISEIQGLVEDPQQPDGTLYIRHSDNLMIGSETVKRIDYVAQNGILTCVSIDIEGADSANGIELLLKNLYGPPDAVNNNEYMGSIIEWYAQKDVEAKVALVKRLSGSSSLVFQWEKSIKSDSGL